MVHFIRNGWVAAVSLSFASPKRGNNDAARRAEGASLMRINPAPKLCLSVRCVLLLVAALLPALAWAPPGFAQSSTESASSPASAQLSSTKEFKNWRNGMAKTPPPGAGCFTSSYPNTEWQQTPCKPAPKNPFMLAPSRHVASTVGNGNDVAVGVQSGTISLAVGSFDSVTGVTSVCSNFGCNDYSLQLNTNLFNSPGCSVATNPSQCQGWVQFLYSQDQCSGPCAFFEYSLINVGSSSNCPAGWGSYNIGEWVCFFNTNGVGPATAPPISDLGNLSLVAEAQVGGNDTVIFSTGSALYLVQNPDNQLGLASGWNSFEYNIVGDCCGTAATFNSGSAITVRAGVESGSTGAPPCVSDTFSGYTGETNNLSFAGAPAAVWGTTPAMMFNQSSSGSGGFACSSATAVASGALVDSHDFNASGMSDVLWRNTSGAVGMWLMNGATIAQNSLAGSAPTTWSIVGQRDFNGDGKADILWHDTSGNVGLWLMDGANVLQSAGVGNVPPTVWSIAGTGDFNGDGRADILWRDTSGNVGVWLMNGTTIMQSAGVANVPPSVWSIAGTGDFDGDGKTDILWIDTAGDVGIWFMNGTQLKQSIGIGQVTSGWSIVGTGDFNGDGKSDILLRNNGSSAVGIWFMNGAQIVQAVGIGTVPSVWSVAATGDFNGDGKSDILWRDTSGDVGVWFMSGATIALSTGIANVSPTVWSIQGAGAD
jgi:hypothetical protein